MPYLMSEEEPSIYFGKLLKIIHDHGHEVYGPGVNVNVFRINSLIATGIAKLFILKYNDEIVGYSFWLTGQDIMFADRFRADEIALFVYKQHRGRPALRFIKFAEMKLRDIGVKNIVRGCQPNNPLYNVLRKLGYGREEVMLVKEC